MLPRQTGKTTSAAVYLCWYAMFHPDQTILIAAHKYTGAQEIMQRIRYVYELCPDHIRAGVTNYNKGSIEFENGSRIVSATTTGNTGRGMSISLLYCDEFAFVAPNIAEEFWTSISPTLATGGRAILTSTPNSVTKIHLLLFGNKQKISLTNTVMNKNLVLMDFIVFAVIGTNTQTEMTNGKTKKLAELVKKDLDENTAVNS